MQWWLRSGNGPVAGHGVARPVAIVAGGGDAARRLWPVMVPQGLWPSTTPVQRKRGNVYETAEARPSCVWVPSHGANGGDASL